MTNQPMPGTTVPGRVFDGKYRVVRHLADGGMGAVFEAEHLVLGKHVAIKVLHPEYAANDDILERFKREARAASAIGHEGIIEIWDMGRSEDGSLFIVMELLRGLNLHEVITKEKRLEAGRAAHILTQTLSALAAAHQYNIVHRDLKPENVFLITRGADADFVKILDFGISKMLNQDQSMKLTSTGFVLGTPYYMAPEQARGGTLDHRVDIYGAGVILYQCVTGRLPFSAPNFNALLFEIAAGKVPPPRSIVPDLPVPFERIIQRAMAVDAQQRYQTSAEFAEALRPFVRTSADISTRTPAPELAKLVLPLQAMPSGQHRLPSVLKPSDRTMLEGQAPSPDQIAAAMAAAQQGVAGQQPWTPPAGTGQTPMALQAVAAPRPAGQGQDGAGGRGRTMLALGLGALLGAGLGVVLFFRGGDRAGAGAAAAHQPRLELGTMAALDKAGAGPRSGSGASTSPAASPSASPGTEASPSASPSPSPGTETSPSTSPVAGGAAGVVDAGVAVAPAVAVSDAAVTRQVTITFEVSPPEATLTWNDEAVVGYTRTVAASEDKVKLKVADPAYRSREVSFRPNKDQTITIRLQKKGSGGTKAPGSQIDL
ncbi:MAG: serine/threonine protein kinase [Deltaproteobacteria bacterium]|nr:serine/threonine protein kinase [Deltaproteobacteria bacterium]